MRTLARQGRFRFIVYTVSFVRQTYEIINFHRQTLHSIEPVVVFYESVNYKRRNVDGFYVISDMARGSSGFRSCVSGPVSAIPGFSGIGQKLSGRS